MWGLKGVAWQPPPALRNGRHTRHTHTPPSSFAISFSLVLPSPFFSVLFFFFLSPCKGCTLYPAHNTYPAPYTNRVRGKFLNFARIENFHILFPRGGAELLAASCSQSFSSFSSFSSCDSCNRTEKFPKAMPFRPAFFRIVSRLAIEDNKHNEDLGFPINCTTHAERFISITDKMNYLKKDK